MSDNIDIVFITPNNSSGIYQELSNEYSAIETLLGRYFLQNHVDQLVIKCQ